MKTAKIYKPAKSVMQSGRGKTKNWVLEFVSKNTGVNPLTGWETSTDTMSEVRLFFYTKEHAIEYAKKNKIQYHVINSQKRKFIIKSYADNFLE